MTNKFSLKDTNAIKGVAIMMLIIYHCFSSEGRLNGYEVSFLLPNGMHYSNLCDICVGIFTFLSAYGISRSLKGKSPFGTKAYGRQYLVHRLTKLYTGFFPVAVICIGVTYLTGNHWYHNKEKGLLYFLMDMGCMSGLMSDNTICGTWWYMTFAIVVVMLVPVYKIFQKKSGLMLSFGTMLFLILFGVESDVMTKWIPTIPIAMWCADENILERFRDYSPLKIKWLDDAVKIIITGILTYLCAEGAMNTTWNADASYYFSYFFHPMAATFFVAFSYMTYIRIKGLNSCLSFVGKYSMNMFLFHTFVRARWCVDFTYGMGKDYLIFIWMFAFSLAFSLALEGIKKLIKYSDFEKFLERNILSLCERLGMKDIEMA